MVTMLSIEQATKKLRNFAQQVDGTETIPIEESLGRTLAAPISAPIDLPPFTSSAMDGYAICGAPIVEAGERFEFVGESRTGPASKKSLLRGQAIRVFTGSAIPDNTTAVVIQEEVKRDKNHIVVLQRLNSSANIRVQGTDTTKGHQLVLGLTPLSPYILTRLAACGITEVEVVRKLKVGVLSTGDELRSPGTPLKFGEIYESNRTALKLLLARKPVDVTDLGCFPDDPSALKSTFESATNKFDVLLSSGGMSVGDTDFVRPALSDLGELVWSIAMKPGKPLALGKLDRTLFFGLPGNPVSTIVTYLIFVEPTLDMLTGIPWTNPARFKAKLKHYVEHKIGRTEFVRGYYAMEEEQLKVTSTGDQSSNRLSSFARCNCLIVIPAHRENMLAGDQVDIILLPGEGNLV